MLSKLLYANDFVLMIGRFEGLRNQFIKWKGTFDSKGFKVIHGKTKVMVNGITKDGLSKSKVDPCWICIVRVKANLVLYVQCGK